MSKPVKVAAGASHKLIKKDLLNVRVAAHFSRRGPTAEGAADPVTGKQDPAEQLRWTPRAIDKATKTRKLGTGGKPAVGLTVAIRGTSITGVTNANGSVSLDVSTLTDGSHTVVVTPDARQLTDTHLAAPATGPVPRNVFNAGPSLAFLDVPATAPTIEFTYRAVEVPISIAAKKLQVHPRIVDPAVRHARILSGASPISFEIDLRPDWVRSKNSTARPLAAIEMIVIHHTGNRIIGPGTLDGFMTGALSANYVVDTDGHVVKMVNDARAAVHAGPSVWDGKPDVSSRSIGIEIVHGGKAPDDGLPYPADQVRAVVRLCQQLVSRQSILERRIAGHEDVGTRAGTGILGRKGGDPGKMFPWRELENVNLGIRLIRTAPADNLLYGGAFAGGAVFMPEAPGARVRELQTDLLAIGYSVAVNGRYDKRTSQAVFAFQRHFGTLDRARTNTFGRVDLRTAREIKQATLWR